MFLTIEYLKSGTTKQRDAYEAIIDLAIMEDLSSYTPILCGTIPIDIGLSHSDLDIIMEVHDFKSYEKQIRTLYESMKGFRLKQCMIRDNKVIKTNFSYRSFEFELFGQEIPVIQQNAYLHMIIEHELLQRFPHLREEVIQLKLEGDKTEPAFCKLLGLKGDPYMALLEYGRSLNIID
ncbi:DUF4269 domain-containing protein [Bacillus salitolerans]|uniref:DUF4269 domain-containing protein n=1 Tax=Bacillus salitolerans TaxID=1437434 RepID=A0ABW4LR02_9BACI